MLSIIIPTLNESDNLDPLIRDIAGVLGAADIVYEIVIVDDSSIDGTVDKARDLEKNFPIKIIERKGLDRDLSLSVLDGAILASYDNIVVMDADLSHPRDCLPLMFAKLQADSQSIVVGSRYIEGGGFYRSWSFWRYLNSRVATFLAKPLTRCSDPMSGFIGFNRMMLKGKDLNPQGYKIGLELMVRCGFSSVNEIPIGFRDREVGESKMNLSQQWKYLGHLRRLYLHNFGVFAEFLHFCFVGLGGLAVDITFYYLLQTFSVPHLWARALSFLPAMTTNWFLNRTTTFGERKRRHMFRQWLEFIATCSFGSLLSWCTYYMLTTSTDFFDNYRFLALFPGMALASIFNFILSTLFVYNAKRR